MELEERYKRHISLKEIGMEGQLKLFHSKVVVIGAGGLGSPIILYLASAGIGEITIIDGDVVSESNLQRQILYRQSDLGLPKVDIAGKTIIDITPKCNVVKHNTFLDNDNANMFLSGKDVIIDATDNTETRYLIDKWSKALNIPFVYGSICEFVGQVSVFNYNGGPSYSDLYPNSNKLLKQPSGVLGAIPGIVGSIQAAECIKLLLNLPSLSGKLLSIDVLNSEYNIFDLNLITDKKHRTIG